MYVKNTKTIWGHVQRQIEELFVSRKYYAANWGNYGMSIEDFNQHCMDVLIPPEHREMINILGSKYFIEMAQVNVRLSYVANDQKSLCTLAVGYPGATKFLGSSSWQSGYYSIPPVIQSPIIQDIASRREIALAHIENEKTQMVGSMLAMYDSHPSINSIVKTLPSFVDFLPPDVVEKLSVKSKPSAKRVGDIDNIQDISVQILKAKVLK